MSKRYPTKGQINFLKWVHFQHSYSFSKRSIRMLSKVLSGNGYMISERVGSKMLFRQSFLNKLRKDHLEEYLQSATYNKIK